MALTDSELSAILEREQRQAIAFQSGDLSKEREDGLKRFYGEPYGNEEDGRSQVVMRDVQEVVEWLLPAQLKIFMSGDQVVEFQPRGPEDEKIAKQRTEYINYVFQQDNNGFLVLYTALKDAFIQKNGVVKVYYDPHALDETRTVEGIDDDAYLILVDDPDIEIIQHTEYLDPNGSDETAGADAGPVPPAAGGALGVETGPVTAGALPLPAAGVASQAPVMAPPTETPFQTPGAMPGMAQPGLPPSPTPAPAGPAILHDVKYRKSGGKVCIEPIPPENWLVSRRATEIRTAPYVADQKKKSISDCIAEGLITKDEAETLPLGGGESPGLTGEAETRRTVPDDDGDADADREGVMREVWVTDHYIQVDADEDGIAERLRIVTIGATTNIVLQEEWEGPPPYASGSPILVPHRIIGQSIADQISDIQLINTTLMRQMLDNLYRTNNPRYAGNGVDQDDWYSPNPGQLVKTDGNPNETLREITIPFTAGASLPVMEYIATLRENRTGVTRYNQGIDANSLNKTASGITQIMNASQQRVELIARIFAETFIKPLFMLIDHCVTKYQNKERIIRIRNEWVPVDPRQWESNFDMTINVGLGTGNKDQQLIHLQNIAAMQAQIIQAQGGWEGPIVTKDNVYETMSRMTVNAGFKNPEAFFTDPAKEPEQPPAPPPPDPEMVKVQQQGEIEKAKLAQQAQNDQAKLALEVEKTKAEMQLEWQKANAQIVMQKEQGALKAQADREKMQGDQELKREVAANKSQIIVGAEGKATKVMDNTEVVAQAVQGMASLLQALIQQQAQRDAAQDQMMQTIMSTLSAEKEVVRGPDGRAMGVRTKMNGAGTVQ